MRAHKNNFDALRLLGALLVLVNHSMILSDDHAYGFAGQSVSTLGVKMFFVISGYMITSSWLRDSHPGRFVLRRARRILPALAFVVLVSILIIGPIFTSLPIGAYFKHPFTSRYLGNLIFYVSYALPGVFTTNPLPNAVNGSLWTLPVEIVMYLLTPLLVLAARRRAPITLLLLLSVSVSMFYVLRSPPPLVILGSEFWSASTLAPYFVAGSAVATLRLERFLDWRLGLLGILFMHLAAPQLAVWQEAVFCFVLPYSVLAVGIRQTPGISSVGRWGDFSYGIYLWAFPIQQMVVATVGPGIGGWSNAALVLPPTVLMAVISWQLIEKHALRLGSPTKDTAAKPLVQPREALG